MERLAFTPELKSFDDEAGTAEFYFSKIGTEDLGKDIVEPGFFQHVISTTPAARVPFMADHSSSVRDRLGFVTSFGEDDKGAYAAIEFALHRELARDVYQDFKNWPASMEFSFAYSLFEQGKGYTYDSKGVRHLLLASGLYDIAHVVKGMHPDTELVGVKEAEEILDTHSNIKLAERDLTEAAVRLKLLRSATTA